MEIKKDFYSSLPSMVPPLLEWMIAQYKDQPWFEKAWNEYRNHILNSDIDMMKMPGSVFNKYTNKLEHSILYDNSSVFKIADEYELYHYGTLGMKWGVRRYQNSDGTLTPEGKLRYKVDSKGKYVKLSGKERRAAKKKASDLEKARKAAEIAKRNKSPRDKKVNEMTNKQLDKYIERMAKEERALQLKQNINRLDPKPVSRGERFISKVWNQTVEPALLNSGRQYLEKLMRDAMNAQDNAKKRESDKKQKEFDEAKRESTYWTNMKNAEKQKQEYEELIKNRKT